MEEGKRGLEGLLFGLRGKIEQENRRVGGGL